MDDHELARLLRAHHQLELQDAEVEFQRVVKPPLATPKTHQQRAAAAAGQSQANLKWVVAAVLLLAVCLSGAAVLQQAIIQRLNSQIEESQVRLAILVEDFSASGRDSISVRGSVDPRYIKRVTWNVRDGDPPLVLHEISVPAEDDAPRVPISKVAEIELGTGRFTSVLHFEPFEDAPPEFFTEERTEQSREFYAGFDGLITDPVPEEKSVVATIEYIVFKGDPNYYSVGGRVSPELAGKHGWLVAYAETSRTYFVLTELTVDDKRDPPVFRATCQIGPDRLDGQDYHLFAAFADDARALHPGQTAPVGFEWSKFERSELKLKANDGTDGFAVDPLASH